jgi:hypothetical protein
MQETAFTRRLAQITWWVGLVSLATGLAMPALRVRFPVGIPVGVGVAALGVHILLAGEITTGPVPRSFTVRGPVVRGQVEVRAGLCNFALGACPTDRIATVRYGPFGEPGFEVREGIAYLQLRNPLHRPNIAQWRADLASNVLWDAEVRSWLGDLTLDLSALRVEHLVARTGLGYLKVTCPQRGYTRMHLRTGLGRVELCIPPSVEARLAVKQGQLATLTVKNERLLALGQGRYATPDFDDAPVQVEVQIESAAGDIILA